MGSLCLHLCSIMSRSSCLDSLVDLARMRRLSFDGALMEGGCEWKSVQVD